jgi:integrase
MGELTTPLSVEGITMPTMRHKIGTRWVLNGRRVAPHTPGAVKEAVESRKWYAFGLPGLGRKAVPLCSNKRVAEQMLAKMVAAGEAGAAGLPSPHGAAASLGELIGQWQEHLEAKGTGGKHARCVASCARRAAAALGWQHPRDIQADAVTAWLARCAETEGVGPQTRNHRRAALREFVRWLAGRGRRLISLDALDDVPVLPVEVDLRRARRSLSVEELGRLLAATLASGQVVRGMTAEQRHLIYSLACATGFRAREVGLLATDALALDAAPPAILLAARRAKNKRTTRQPLPADVAALLRAYCEGRQGRLFPGYWWELAAKMLQVDLQRAGIPYRVETDAGPLYADFHALRHTYVSLLEAAGVSLRDAMQLARHSDPHLTLARYGRSQADALGRAVERLPLFGAPEDDGGLVRLFAFLLAVAGVDSVCLPACPSAGPDGTKPDTTGDNGTGDSSADPRRNPEK